MRNVLNISAVLACALLAGLCGLIQGEPSRAASVSGSAMIASGPQFRAADPAIMVVRKAGGVDNHFAAANTSHDGHLTYQQAVQGDWPRVARHFQEIDADHKGWITRDQVHQFNRTHVHHRKDGGVS